MDFLAELLSSHAMAELCRMLFDPQTEEPHMRDLTRRSGCTLSAVQRELDKLLRLGLVTRRQEGNRVYFQVDPPRHSFYPEMCERVGKSSRLPEMLAAALKG